jgi:hypothetical protein
VKLRYHGVEPRKLKGVNIKAAYDSGSGGFACVTNQSLDKLFNVHWTSQCPYVVRMGGQELKATLHRGHPRYDCDGGLPEAHILAHNGEHLPNIIPMQVPKDRRPDVEDYVIPRDVRKTLK